MQIKHDKKDRIDRIDREHVHELQKIEVATYDVSEISIDTRILNKIKRKAGRRK